MGYRHDREDVLRAAVQVASDSGLGKLTFRATGRHLGIADRTVVYYYPNKTDLVTAVLGRATEQLLDTVAPAVGDSMLSERELLAVSWGALQQPRADPWVRLYAETLGLAVRGNEPYAFIASGLAQTWIHWLALHLVDDRPDGSVHDRAAGLLAILDGLLFMHTTVGPEVAASAFRGLAIPPD
ncbi:TetR/AcrR family transcriptional regulator [Nocardioides sp.]|uniref:TetR/AcrR family transcriptional regulator n=1 Tax=Nocardioides sp. TaxID=35761 RepID=UPI002C13323F|nr:TetR/AcrR family transcriptional regulator [Nocardioides sp.]HXH77028.1 TetR/AcrR family transcriptional regulator [Nocardioides sp.]